MRDLISRSRYTEEDEQKKRYYFDKIREKENSSEKKEPGLGGVSKLPRNFLTVGTCEHQLLKSSKDIPLSSPPPVDLEKEAALRSASTISLYSASELVEKTLLKTTTRTNSKSDLKRTKHILKSNF